MLGMNFQLFLRRFMDSRWMRFLSTGVLNTAFGYFVYAVMVFEGIAYSVALVVATVLGVVFNFFSFGRLVFRGQHGLVVFLKFVLAYCVVYVVNVTLLGVVIKDAGFNAYVAQAMCVPPSVLLSWILMNHWVFKK